MSDSVDFIDPETYASGIPYELLGRLRREAPVHRVDEPPSGSFKGGPGYWLVLRHNDVAHVSRNPADFSSWRGTAFMREQRPTDIAVLRRMMLNMDPPEHTKLRKIVNKAFTPGAIRKSLGASIERHAREVVDSICEQGSVEFLGAVAAEMPLLILAEILGVPAEDRHLLYSWTNALVGIDDPEYGGDPQVFLTAFQQMFEYSRAQTAAKRSNPGDDVWSIVVNAEVDGERLSNSDLDRFFQLLMVAGNETTRNLIAGGVATLSEHPDQFDLVRNDPSLVPSAIEELLRYHPPVIQFRRTATHDLDLAGQRIAENHKVVIHYASANRDETVFDNPDTFDIRRDPNPHISFGDGTHFCLGANLARLEVRALYTELFSRIPDITVIGDVERMRSSFINGIKRMPVTFTPVKSAAAPLTVAVSGNGHAAAAKSVAAAPAPTVPNHGTPMVVLFGSNFGTAEETAQFIAEEGRRRGFDATTADLDNYVKALPTSCIVVIVTATYNGTPPDNAVQFAQWITSTTESQRGVNYAVFGCGNSEWAATFQHFPRTIDARLATLGATRICEHGEGDAHGDFDGQLEGWSATLWPAAAAAMKLDPSAVSLTSRRGGFRIDVVPGSRPSPFVESRGASPMRVASVRCLTRAVDGVEPKPVYHLDLDLPLEVTYNAGDHLGVIPHNSEDLVSRVARRFDLDLDNFIRLRSDDPTSTFLPVDERISLRALLTDYVELQGVASRRDVEVMLEHTEYPWTRNELEGLIADHEAGGARFRDHIVKCRRSVLDLLEQHPACDLPFPVYLEMLSPLAPRYYSIASSSLTEPRQCAVTVGLLSGPARSGIGTYSGVCSTYLSGKQYDQYIYAFVRDTSSTFRLPDDPATPLIMIGSGTGVAPFRGFCQQREGLADANHRLGAALLLVGCRHPQADLLYADELRRYHDRGIVQVAHAYSRVPGTPKVYVQDRVAELGDTVWELLTGGAHVYICGATAMSEGVGAALTALYRDRTGSGADEASAWFRRLSEDDRYHVDVWGTG
jgi:cytochrome P450 / NADPH-cytochrome P450 reductase